MIRQAPLRSWDAVVLAGGTSRRMHGADKLALDIAGRSMLDRAVDAVAGAEQVVVVGPQRAVDLPVLWCREEPPGTGPAAAVLAALPLVQAERVVLLAGDQPLVDAVTVQRLLAAVDGDGAVAVDVDGRAQWLCSAWRVDALRAAPLRPGGSLHAAFADLSWAAVVVDPPATMDCDTPDDVRRARELA